MDKTYLTTAETAKLVRKELKKNFPGVKFSVRSDGNALRIEYTDGPLSSEVKKITDAYSGAGFDGMVDYEYYKSHYYNELTGEVCLAVNQGSACTGGYVEKEVGSVPTGEGWKLVSFGSKYVFVTHHLSVEVLEEAVEMTSKKLGFDSNLVEVVYSDYGSWVKTEKLVANLGWSNETQWKVNQITENGKLISAGNYLTK